MPVMCIKQRREAAGLAQAALSVKMGCVQSAVANWEMEISLPKARDLPRLAKVLGCTIDDLFVKEAEEGQDACPDPEYYDTTNEE